MHAVILAGGKGTRLKPYTAEIPKPLVSVEDKPIIEVLLRRMRRDGVTEVHIAVNHLAHLIMAVLGDGSKMGMDIKYSLEDEPLSTVGPLKLIDNLEDNFLVANGDILTDIDFRKLFDNHIESGARMTVATHCRKTKIDYGVMNIAADGLVRSFSEKPIYELTVSMGIYVFNKSILDLVPERKPFGFDNLMLTMIRRQQPVNTFPYDGYWMDIGRPDDYERAKTDVKKMPELLE